MQPAITIIVGDRFFVLSSYSTLMYLAATLGLALGLAIAARRGFTLWRIAVCMVLMIVATPIGARLFDVITKTGYYVEEPARIFAFGVSGFSLFGGMLLAFATGLVACRILRLNPARVADTLAPALGVSIAVMRLGCFMAGCCFGTETDLPWGVVFPSGSGTQLYQLVQTLGLFSTAVEPVHPTQLYEAAAGLIAAALAIVVIRRKLPDGTAFLVACTWFAAFRLANHFFRVPGASLTTPEWFYPALYAGIISLCLGLMLLRRTHSCLGLLKLLYRQRSSGDKSKIRSSGFAASASKSSLKPDRENSAFQGRSMGFRSGSLCIGRLEAHSGRGDQPVG